MTERSCRSRLLAQVATERTFLTYGDHGQRELDISGLSGIYGSSMLSMYWYPSYYSPLVQGVQGGHGGVAIQTGLNLLKEFSPELARPFRRLRHNHGSARGASVLQE